MEKSSFFNAEIINGEYDRVYLAEDYARYFASFIGNGVFPNPSNNLRVVATGNNMKVTVKAGKAWINGYYYENDSDLILNVAPADGVLDRIDRVVVRYDLAEREITIKIKQGTFASEPVSKGLERNTDIYELALADIKVNHGAISITNSNIKDLRLNSNLCGIVHGTVEQVDTTDIFNAYQNYLDEKMNSDEFNEWFISLKNKLDPNEDVVMQLQIQIAELEENMKRAVNSDMVDGKHASGTLLTNEKNDLVGAINEVFTNASNGKSLIAGAITGMGGVADDNMTFEQLANSLKSINMYKVASGTAQVDPESGDSQNRFYISTIDFPFETVKFFSCIGTMKAKSSSTANQVTSYDVWAVYSSDTNKHCNYSYQSGVESKINFNKNKIPVADTNIATICTTSSVTWYAVGC